MAAVADREGGIGLVKVCFKLLLPTTTDFKRGRVVVVTLQAPLSSLAVAG